MNEDDYIKEFYSKIDVGQVTDVVSDAYLDDDLCKLISQHFLSDSIDAKHKIGEAVSKFIIDSLADDANEYAADEIFENRIRPAL